MSNIDIIRGDESWKNTSLELLFDILESSPTSLGCSKNTLNIKHTFLVGGGMDVNSQFKTELSVCDYELINSILSLPIVIYNEKAFSRGLFKIKHLKSLNCNNIYTQVDNNYIYLMFFNRDLSQLFTILIKRREKTPRDHYEYADIDDTHIGVYLISDYPTSYVFDNNLNIFTIQDSFQSRVLIESIEEGSVVVMTHNRILCTWEAKYDRVSTSSRRIIPFNDRYYFFRYGTNDWYNAVGYSNLENELFFENLQKFIKIKNLQNIQNISDSDFWLFFNVFLSHCNTTSSSGVRRTLKYKIIIINSLLGFPRLNEKFFSLNQFHFNRVKNAYYFTNKLEMSKVLEFSFITPEERSYIENMKASIEGSITMSWKREEVNLLFDKSSGKVKVLFGTIEEAMKLVKNKNENQIKDKFKSLYNISLRDCPWEKIWTKEKLERVLDTEMNLYRKITKRKK